MSAHSRKQKEVWEACDYLSQRGEKLTYKAIGDTLVEMGHCRGSNSDIFRYLKTWRTKDGSEVNDASERNFAQELNLSLSDTGIKDEFSNLSNKLVDSERKLAEKIAGLEHTTKKILQEQRDNVRPENLPLPLSPDLQIQLSEESVSKNDLIASLLSADSPALTRLESWLDQYIDKRESTMVSLFEHHAMQFDQYMSALEQLRQANNLLTSQMANIRATLTAQAQEKDKRIEELNEQLSRERKRRMQMERAVHSQSSERDTWT